MADTTIQKQGEVFISQSEYDALRLAGNLQSNTKYHITKTPKTGVDSLEQMNLLNGDKTATYNTTDGMTINGQTRFTYDGGTTKDVPMDIQLPIVDGEGIIIDKVNGQDKVEVKLDTAVTDGKYVAKHTNPTYKCLYGVYSSGNQIVEPYSEYAKLVGGKWTIAQRYTNGRLRVGTAVEDSDAMPKKQVDDGFVAKVTSPGVVYCTDGNGNQSKINYANTVSNYTVVTRDASGHVRTADPEGQNDATNKKYVDDGFVPKRTTKDGVYLYAYDSTGNISQTADTGANPYTVARRDAGGVLNVGDPVGQYNAVNKAYADARFRYTHLIEVKFNPAPEPYVSYVLIGIITYVSESSTPLTSIDDLPLDVALPIHGKLNIDTFQDTYTATRKTRKNGTSYLNITYMYYSDSDGIGTGTQGDIVPTSFTDTVV